MVNLRSEAFGDLLRTWGGLAIWAGVTVCVSSFGCDGSQRTSEGAAAKTQAVQEEDGTRFGGRLAPKASLRETLEHPDVLQRIPRLAQILVETKPEAAEDVIAELERSPLAWGDLEYVLIASWWSRFDPKAAMAYAQSELRLSHPRVKAEILRTWGRVDRQGLLDSGLLVGQSLDTPGLDAESVDAMVVGWFEGGGEGLDEWLQANMTSDPSATAAALRAYTRMRTLRDGDRETLEWSLKAPLTPELRRLVLGTALHLIARRNPALAAEWLEVVKKEGVDVRTFVARIARGWAHQSPTEAMEFAINAEAEPLEIDRAMRDVARIWVRNDAEGLTAWLTSQKGKAWADPVRYQSMVLGTKLKKYRVDWRALAEQTSETVTDELRRSQLLWVVQHWKAIDPKAAEAWLADHGERLGPQIEFVDQLMSDDRKAVDQFLADEAARAEAAKASSADASS